VADPDGAAGAVGTGVRDSDPMGDDKAAGDAPFESLAETADRIAGTVEHSAAVHDEMGQHLPEAREHAERDRRLAAAERAAAAAYRAHQVPPEDVRTVIRGSRADGDPG
jgi:hypothetical protein